MTDTTEDLLRASGLQYGHIQLFRDESGWQADVCHYRREPRGASGGRVFGDPVEALRAALIEDERVQRDVARKYAGAAKVGGVKCGFCGEPQFDTPSGATCVNGHGGADGVLVEQHTPSAAVDVDLSEFGL